MTIRVCAWHRLNFGRPAILGVSLRRLAPADIPELGPFGRLVTHGICRRCLLIATAELAGRRVVTPEPSLRMATAALVAAVGGVLWIAALVLHSVFVLPGLLE